MEILICSIEEQQYGFQLTDIKRVILSVEIAPIPNAPAHVKGAINVHGEILPVINLRHIFGWPSKELEPNDRFILCHIGGKQLALWVDKVNQVKKYTNDELVSAKELLPDLDSFEFALKDAGRIVLLYDLEKLISPIECGEKV